MTDMSCTYGPDRDDALVAFLYDDTDTSPAERARFDTHLRACARCREDLAALRGVRAQLSKWAPPEPSFVIVSAQSTNPQSNSQSNSQSNPQLMPQSNPQSAIRNPQWWRDIPAWAQVAAALLFLGVSAGVANLDVRYDQNGLSVRTGWSPGPGRADGSGRSDGSGGSGRSGASDGSGRSGASSTDVAQGVGNVAQGVGNVAQGFSPGKDAPWRADLAALERQLRTELRTSQASAQTIRTASTADADVSRVRALMQDSEKRQQRELALRIAELLRDVNAQRQADLVKIDRTLGVVTNNVGVEVMRNRQQMDQMNLLYRASQRQ